MNIKNLAMWAIIVVLTIGLYNMFKNPQINASKNNPHFQDIPIDHKLTLTKSLDNPFKAYNPQSARFSTFTFAPRHCMGMNFAQMEMRVILCHLFRNFDFELGGPTKEADPASYVGVNRATLGPRDTGIDESKPAVLGMYLKVTPIR